jgi:hypothetical protein
VGFRSKWGADLFAGVRSVVGTAARRGKNAYQAICAVLAHLADLYRNTGFRTSLMNMNFGDFP